MLVDGDLRRPSVAKLFGLGKIPGLTEWLQGESGPMTSIYHLEESWNVGTAGGRVLRNPVGVIAIGQAFGTNRTTSELVRLDHD